jgi:fatty acid amide hydrolase
VKECFDVAGRATTLGIPAWRDRIADQDSAMVRALRHAGAIVLGRTNLSQTMLYVEARNPVFGQTANPWSLAHTPGGSSGGEGAAIAAGASPLGVGTDIGGSIRTPAHFCGVAGLKPTLDRLPMKGYRTVLAGQEAVRGMGGPLARTTADLALFFPACRRCPSVRFATSRSTGSAWASTPTMGCCRRRRRSRAPSTAPPPCCASAARS